MATTLGTMIGIHCISGQKTPHEDRKRYPVAAQKKVKMIVEQGPGKTVSASFFKQKRESLQKHAPVLIVAEYFPSRFRARLHVAAIPVCRSWLYVAWGECSSFTIISQ
jgi:hypothetical protein